MWEESPQAGSEQKAEAGQQEDTAEGGLGLGVCLG